MSAFLFLLLLFFLCGGKVYALETGEDFVQEQLQGSGYYDLFSLLPEEALEGGSAEDLSPEQWKETGVYELLEKGKDLVLEKAGAPLRLAGKLMGAVLLLAVVSAAGGNPGLKTAAHLTMAALLAQNILQSAESSVRLIRNLTRFMGAFLPVFAAAAGASGKPASSAVWYGVTLAAIELFSAAVSGIVLPLTIIFAAAGISCAAAPDLGGEALMKAVKGAALWVLSFFLTLFLAFLMVKTGVSGITDGVALKTAKFLLGSAVPVVGSALGDAWSALSGCLALVKSTVGVFGLLVLGAVFLPKLCTLFLTMTALSAAAAVSETLGEKTAAGLIRTGESALSILAAVLICCGIMLAGAVAMVLLAGSG